MIQKRLLNTQDISICNINYWFVTLQKLFRVVVHRLNSRKSSISHGMYWQNTEQVKTMEHSHTLDPQALTYRQQMHQWYFQIAVRTRNKKTSLSNLIKSNRKGNHLKWQVNIMQEITLGTAMLHAVDAAYLLTSFHSIDSVSIIDCILICHLCKLLMARRWPDRTVQNNRTFLCLSSVSILFSRSWNSSL